MAKLLKIHFLKALWMEIKWHMDPNLAYKAALWTCLPYNKSHILILKKGCHEFLYG